MKKPLSLVVITLNEERNIERCLKSVPFASEIIVVDSFSSDSTCAKAQSLGAKVIQTQWRGFGPTKAYAVSLASHDWILSLDADEALSPELQREIQEKFGELDPRVGYEIPRKSFYLGRWILHGGWYPDRQLRLFHRQHSRWSESSVHERIQAPQVRRLQSEILHWVFRDISHQVVTNDRYSGLQAEQWLSQGKEFSLFKLLTKPVSKFFETYIFKKGFLDGLPGFIIAVSAGYSVFLRHAKVWESSQRRGAQK